MVARPREMVSSGYPFRYVDVVFLFETWDWSGMVRVCVRESQVSVDLSVPKLRRRGLEELSNTAAAALPAKLEGA